MNCSKWKFFYSQYRLQSDYGSLVKKELLRRLQKAEKRKGQFLYQIEKHEKLAKSATKDDLVERYQRKVSQVSYRNKQHKLYKP